MSSTRRISPVPILVAAVALLLALLPAATGTAQEAQPVPHPDEVEGPVPFTHPDDGGDPQAADIDDTYPWFASTVDLEAHGYVEEEYHLHGTGNHYEDGEVASSGHEYTTRMVVRRPADPDDFSGTVLQEWQNVSGGFDIDAMWATYHEHLMEEGHVWVGVSVQNEVGAIDLKNTWSPVRYGDLDVRGGLDADHLSYDIFAQAGRLIAEPVDVDVIGAPVDDLIAIGASRSAGRLRLMYDNVLQAMDDVPFDGYMPVVTGSPSTEDDPFRGDRPEPVFQIIHEADAEGTAQPQPDSEVYVRWEITGTTHSTWRNVEFRNEPIMRELGLPEPPTPLDENLSRIPNEQIYYAALEHMIDWVRDGTPPPAADPIVRDDDGVVERDEDGFALGGIRMSQIQVPIMLNDADGHELWSDEEIDARYRNHGQYVSAVMRAENQLVRDGYILQSSSQENRREAARSDVGR